MKYALFHYEIQDGAALSGLLRQNAVTLEKILIFQVV